MILKFSKNQWFKISFLLIVKNNPVLLFQFEKSFRVGRAQHRAHLWSNGFWVVQWPKSHSRPITQGPKKIPCSYCWPLFCNVCVCVCVCAVFSTGWKAVFDQSQTIIFWAQQNSSYSYSTDIDFVHWPKFFVPPITNRFRGPKNAVPIHTRSL